MKNTIYSIGHQGYPFWYFLSTLSQHKIDTIIDIRGPAICRKTGFSKNSLPANLNKAGIEYEHIPELGCPKEVRDKFLDTQDMNEYRQSYLNSLPNKDESLSRLISLANQSNCVMMGFDAAYAQCHRHFIGEELKEHLYVCHLS